MKSIISSHNKKTLNSDKGTEQARMCNCRVSNDCPLNGECLTPAVVYKAHVNSNGSLRDYTGCTEPEFKTRWRNHKSSFKHSWKRTDSKLSVYVWELREQHGVNDPNITWSVHQRRSPYHCGSRKCDLCLSEKLAILKNDTGQSLNNIYIYLEFESNQNESVDGVETQGFMIILMVLK